MAGSWIQMAGGWILLRFRLPQHLLYNCLMQILYTQLLLKIKIHTVQGWLAGILVKNVVALLSYVVCNKWKWIILTSSTLFPDISSSMPAVTLFTSINVPTIKMTQLTNLSAIVEGHEHCTQNLKKSSLISILIYNLLALMTITYCSIQSVFTWRD